MKPTRVDWRLMLLHNIVAYGILALMWTKMMDLFGGDLTLTVLGGFILFSGVSVGMRYVLFNEVY